MKNDGLESKKLQKTLGEVRAGRLTPQQAAQRMLASEQSQNSAGESATASKTGLPGKAELAGNQTRDAITTPRIAFENLESLQSLLQRLGRPPNDIIEVWCRQIESVALIHQSELGAPMGVIQPSDWKVDASGRLIWCDNHGRFLQADSHSLATASSTVVGELPPEVRERIDAFRAELKAVPSIHSEPAARVASQTSSSGKEQVDPPSSTVVNYGEVSRAEKKRQTAEKFAQALSERFGTPLESAVEPGRMLPEKSVRPERKFGWFYKSLVVIGFVGLVGLIVNSSRDRLASTKESGNQKPEIESKQDVPTSSLSQGFDSNPNDRQTATIEPVELELFLSEDQGKETPESDFMVPIDSSAIGPQINGPTAIVTSSDSRKDDERRRADLVSEIPAEPAVENSDETSAVSSILNMPLVDLKAVGRDAAKAEQENLKKESEEAESVPQPTRPELSNAIQLPPLDDDTAAVAIPLSDLRSAKLVFPGNMQISSQSSNNGMTILATGKKVPIASLRPSETGIEFRWTLQAKTTSLSPLLANGCLVSGDQELFLRPVIQAAPIPLSLQRIELHPTWDLATAVPARSTRLGVELVTPDEIELAWLQPIDAKSTRRTIGRLVLQPTDGETIQVGLAMEIRCGKTLSCRIQCVGRLDPSDPWTPMSRPMIERYLDALNAGSEKLLHQKSLMATAYSDANTDLRRKLKPRKDFIDDELESFEEITERVGDMLKLMAQIERDVQVKIRVWVVWPDEKEQTLLEMVPVN